MKNPVLFAIYDFDHSLFITLFCENKNKPQLNCDGNCFLAKIQLEEQEQDAALTLKQLQNDTAFYFVNLLESSKNHDLQKVKSTDMSGLYHARYSYLFSSRLTKPPNVEDQAIQA